MQQVDDKAESGEPDVEKAVRLFTEGQAASAAALCEQILALRPAQGHALHLLGVIRAGEGAFPEALAILEQALATGLIHPSLHYAHANVLLQLERYDAAVAAARRSLVLDAAQPHCVRLLCAALLHCGLPDEAEQVLEPYLAANDRSPAFLDTLAGVRRAQGRYREAQALLEECLVRDPGYQDAIRNLAIVYEQRNQVELALPLIESGLHRWPDDHMLLFLEARCRRRQGDFAAAISGLTSLTQLPGLVPALTKDIEFELGWCADAMGHASAAMDHFTSANRLAEDITGSASGLRGIYSELVAANLRMLHGRPAHPETVLPIDGDSTSPVFLVGFPRSGTTLLDTMLGAHPGVCALEERPTLQAMLDALQSQGRVYPDDIPQLSPAMIGDLRRVYREVCRKSGWDGAGRILDKSPFATAHVALLNRMFPGTPILFAVRHPCDVCLSCFMNNFEINSGTAHFTSLENTVRLYSEVMTLWFECVRVLPLRYQLVRYEDLVEDAEAVLRSVLAFIGLEWHDAVRDHRNEVRGRDRIPTPSYSQVNRPLYRDALGRWRRYESYLEPFREQLEPIARKLGYES